MTTLATRRLLARPEDLHCVVFHVTVLLGYGAAFWLWHEPDLAGIEGPWSRAAFVAGAAFLLGWVSGVDVGVNFHNHTHRRIFTRPWLNRWFGRVWTFSGGWPAYFWEHAHVKVHHGKLLGDDDWTMPRRRADGRFENIYRYVLCHWPWRFAVHLWRDFTSPQGRQRFGRRVGRRALLEFVIFLALWSIPFWIDPWMGLCLWLLPQWVGNAITMGSGMYVQHAGGVPKSATHQVRHSTCFVSRFFNVTMFNIGYHTTHHDHPGVHWADLPAMHAHLREDLIAGGAHVVPYGYYRAASIVANALAPESAFAQFVTDQDPRYEAAPARAARSA